MYIKERKGGQQKSYSYYIAEVDPSMANINFVPEKQFYEDFNIFKVLSVWYTLIQHFRGSW